MLLYVLIKLDIYSIKNKLKKIIKYLYNYSLFKNYEMFFNLSLLVVVYCCTDLQTIVYYCLYIFIVYMRNIVLLVLLFLFGFMWVTTWYYQQWFSSYNENWSNIDFKCEKDCVIMLDKLYDNEYIMIDWLLSGNWNLLIWFVQWNNLYPWKSFSVVWNREFVWRIELTDINFFKQIPKDTYVIIIINWKINGHFNKFILGTYWFWESIINRWTEFWKLDSYISNTINLIKWPKNLWDSINGFFYILFFIWIFILWIFSFNKGRSKYLIQWIMILWFVLWVIYDIRMWIETTWYFVKDYISYISQDSDYKNMILRDRWSFYGFTSIVQNTLDKLYNQWKITHDEVISFYTDNIWPFPGSMTYLLYPYKVLINEKSQTDILSSSIHKSSKIYIVFWFKDYKIIWKDLILSWSYIWNWEIIEFLPSAFIFIKN